MSAPRFPQSGHRLSWTALPIPPRAGMYCSRPQIQHLALFDDVRVGPLATKPNPRTPTPKQHSVKREPAIIERIMVRMGQPRCGGRLAPLSLISDQSVLMVVSST